ncbi:hypothetical protein [Sorangium sp. So ce1151]|uniref:hypothetical protein n=1 Tax=Sorangium sp. So ce1151 TaxID=3133332 RepID=UPI003F638678
MTRRRALQTALGAAALGAVALALAGDARRPPTSAGAPVHDVGVAEVEPEPAAHEHPTAFSQFVRSCGSFWQALVGVAPQRMFT